MYQDSQADRQSDKSSAASDRVSPPARVLCVLRCVFSSSCYIASSYIFRVKCLGLGGSATGEWWCPAAPFAAAPPPTRPQPRRLVTPKMGWKKLTNIKARLKGGVACGAWIISRPVPIFSPHLTLWRAAAVLASIVVETVHACRLTIAMYFWHSIR